MTDEWNHQLTVLMDLLYSYRIREGITQKELSQRTGLCQSVVSDMENGKIRPLVPTLQRYASGFGLELELRLIDVDQVVYSSTGKGYTR